jgi:tRNA uridine 5-carbamoylmethylation protein Kti12
LLTGEPGAGKTAISDQLTQFSQSSEFSQRSSLSPPTIQLIRRSPHKPIRLQFS